MALSMKKPTIFPEFKRPYPIENQLRFIQRLSRLINNGYPLLDALEMMKWDKDMRKPAQVISEFLTSGKAIDFAFEQAGFSEKVLSYLYFSKSNGNLEQSLDRCYHMLQQQAKYTKKFQQTSRYPFILGVLLCIILFFVKTSVYPSFIQLFQSSQTSTTTTKMSILLIDILFNTSSILLAATFLSFPLWKMFKKKIWIGNQLKAFSKMPIYRSFLRMKVSFLFATHFSSLLQTGMPLKEALQVLARQKRLPVVRFYSKLMINDLEKGLRLPPLLSSLNFLEKELTSIFQKTSTNTVLQKDLNIYAEFLTERQEIQMKKLIGLIQPIFFIIIALLIMFVYLSIMLPMFQLIKTI